MWAKGVSGSSRCCSVGPDGATIASEHHGWNAVMTTLPDFFIVTSNWVSRMNTANSKGRSAFLMPDPQEDGLHPRACSVVFRG